MRITHVTHNECVSRPVIGLICWRVVIYFQRLFCRGDKFMCRETFPNRNEYYTRSCVFIDNNNYNNNGSSGNNHCNPRPVIDTRIHRAPPFRDIVACTKKTPLYRRSSYNRTVVSRTYYSVPHVEFVHIAIHCK